jgi:O-antigen/teichoic acid export membrane protein
LDAPGRSTGSKTTLLWGTLLAGFVSISVAPILSRLYSPDAFGALATVVAIVTVWSTAANGGIETAIPRVPPSYRMAVANLGARVSWLAAGLAIGSSLAVGTLWVSTPIGAVLQSSALAIGMGVLALGWSGLAISLSLTEQRSSDVSTHRVVSATTTAVLQTALYRFGAAGLISGFVSGRLPPSLRDLRRAGVFRATPRREFREIWDEVPAINRALTRVTPAALLNGFATQTIPIAIAMLFGLRVAGLFALVHRVLAVPTAILGRALSEDAVSQAAQVLQGADPLRWRRSLKHQVLLLFVGSIAGAIALYAIGEVAFVKVFGSEWAGAGELALYVWPLYAAQTCLSPVSRILPVLSRDGSQLLWDATRLLGLIATVLLVSALDMSVPQGLTVLVAWMTSMYAIHGFMAWRALMTL